LKIITHRAIGNIVSMGVYDILMGRIEIVVIQSQYAEMRILSPKSERNGLILRN